MNDLVNAVKDTGAWRDFDAASRRHLEIINHQCFYAPITTDYAIFVAGMSIRYVAEKRQAVMQTAAYERLRDAQTLPMHQEANAWEKLLRA